MAHARTAFGIVPPTGLYVREDRCQTPVGRLKTIALRPPIDLLCAGGAIEAAGATARPADYPAEGRGWQDLERDLRELRPDVLLLSCTTQTLRDDVAAAGLARQLRPEPLTVAKGAHFNVARGAWAEAQAALARAVAIDPTSLTLANALGVAAARAGDPVAARAAFEQAHMLAPEDGQATNNLAWLLATSADDDVRDPARAATRRQSRSSSDGSSATAPACPSSRAVPRRDGTATARKSALSPRCRRRCRARSS